MNNIYSEEDGNRLHQWQQINHQYGNDPLARIRLKLPLAKQRDEGLELFGADSHQYQLNPPISLTEIEKWEKRTGARLPDDFVAFLTQIGNGGAGPYYGIERFEDSESRFNKYVELPSVLSPNMSQSAWEALTTVDDDCSDEEYDEKYDLIHRGLFYLGTCGCEYDLLLVITGEYAGRIVYTNDWCDSSQPYFFSYEMNFLQWYERWLDEVIQQYETSWFGHRMGGDESVLLKCWAQADNEEEQITILNGLTKLPELSNVTLIHLTTIIDNDHRILGQKALSLLTQFSAVLSEPYLHKALKSADIEWQNLAIKSIFWYQKDSFGEYKAEILKQLSTAEHADFISFSGYILKELQAIKVEDYQWLFSHSDPKIAIAALYAASADSNLQHKISAYYPSMVSDNPNIALIAIQSLIKLDKVIAEGIPYLEAAWKLFPPEKNEYIRGNIRRYINKFNVEGDFSAT